MSFADPNLPEGTQFLGGAMVRGFGMVDAVSNAHRLGINPGGQVKMWGPIPTESIPENHPLEVLLSREQIDAINEVTNESE